MERILQLVASRTLQELRPILQEGKWHSVHYREPDPLRVWLRSTKTTYVFGEPLEFEVKIENVSKAPLKMFADFDPLSKCLAVYLKKGATTMSNSGLRVDPALTKEEQLKILAPGETILKTARIENYEKSQDGQIYFFSRDGKAGLLVPEGDLEAVAIYQYAFGDKSKERAPKGVLTGLWESESVTITLKSVESKPSVALTD